VVTIQAWTILLWAWHLVNFVQVRATLMRALYIVLFSTPMVFGSMFALAVFFVRGYVFLEISTLVYEVAAMTALLELVVIREGGDDALIRFAASRSGEIDYYAVLPCCCIPFNHSKFTSATLTNCRRRQYLLLATVVMLALFNILMASIEVAIPNSIEYGLLLVRLVFLGYAFHGLMVVVAAASIDRLEQLNFEPLGKLAIVKLVLLTSTLQNLVLKLVQASDEMQAGDLYTNKSLRHEVLSATMVFECFVFMILAIRWCPTSDLSADGPFGKEGYSELTKEQMEKKDEEEGLIMPGSP